MDCEKLLPEWQCHKRVRGARIGRIERGQVPGCSSLILQLPPKFVGGPGFVAVEVDQAWIERFKPEVGGYYVQYQDGYASFSPAKAFEEGYELILRDVGGPYVLRKVDLRQIERLVAAGIEFDLQPDGMAKIPIETPLAVQREEEILP